MRADSKRFPVRLTDSAGQRAFCVILCSALSGCGTFGLELLPLDDDGGVPDPTLDATIAAATLDASAPDAAQHDASTPPGCTPGNPACFDASALMCTIQSSTDTTCNGIDDNCNGKIDEGFVDTSSTCGVGVCASTGIVSCVSGTTVDSCVAGKPTLASDTTCNGLDEDCNGKVDDAYKSTTTSCGVGACVASGSTSCVSGAVHDSCVAKTPTTTVDDAFAPGNGIDDDCDGQIDEDVPTCNTAPLKYEAGSYPNVAVPGNCHTLSVQLWGGGGGGGQSVGLAVTSGGAGGPGGYAQASASISGKVELYVGSGGANDCATAGSNAGSSNYNGGAGGTGAGKAGADGKTSGGGSGGAPSGGLAGGNGYFGGGGGGQGASGLLGGAGSGGGGGAATVLIVNGVRTAVAGGGGGGGGAQTSVLGLLGSAGGAGGSGCKGNGQVGSSMGGGGGGGGLCSGTTTQAGSGTTPASSGSTPSGRAKGGSASCGAGGAGYAILTFSP